MSTDPERRQEAREDGYEPAFEVCLGCGHESVVETRYLAATSWEPAERDLRCTCVPEDGCECDWQT